MKKQLLLTISLLATASLNHGMKQTGSSVQPQPYTHILKSVTFKNAKGTNFLVSTVSGNKESRRHFWAGHAASFKDNDYNLRLNVGDKILVKKVGGVAGPVLSTFEYTITNQSPKTINLVIEPESTRIE